MTYIHVLQKIEIAMTHMHSAMPSFVIAAMGLDEKFILCIDSQHPLYASKARDRDWPTCISQRIWREAHSVDGIILSSYMRQKLDNVIGTHAFDDDLVFIAMNLGREAHCAY